MGAYTASVSRSMFAELNRYVQTVVQMGVPWIDADENDRSQMLYTAVRRLQQKLLGDGALGDGFKIVGYGGNNTVTIKGGSGTADGAGRAWVGGHACLLASDEDYKATTRQTAAVSTGLTATILSDSAADFTLGGAPNNLVGRTIVPNIADGTGFIVTANTVNTVTVSGNMLAVAAVGQKYRLEMSMPIVPRTDRAYMDVYLDEIDATEDTNLLHNLGTSIEAQRRLKVIEVVNIAEGVAVPAAYTDSDGHQHFTFPLAVIARTATPVINSIDVTDSRAKFAASTQALLDEVVAARGSQASLDARLDVSLNEDGTLKPAAAFGGGIELEEITVLRPKAQAVPDNTVRVESGRIEKVSGTGSVAWVDGPSPIFPPVSAQPRIDVLALSDAGALVIVPGVEAAVPVPPAYPSDKQVICEVLIDELAGVIIDTSDITDVRPLFTKGVGAVTAEVVAARGSQGSLDARLDVSLNEDGTLKTPAIVALGSAVWTKYTIPYTAFTAASMFQSVPLFTLPARGVIEGVVIKHSSGFAGGGLTGFTVEVGVTGDEDRFATAFNVFQVPGSSVAKSSAQQSIEDFASTTPVLVTGRSAAANVNAVTIGSVDIWVKSSTLPA